MFYPPRKQKIKQIKTVQSSIETCTKDEYTIGYYNGLEYALCILENREPNYKMWDRERGDDNGRELEKPKTKSGYIKRKGGH